MLQLDQEQRTITIFTGDESYSGNYTIKVVALTKTGDTTGGQFIFFELEVTTVCLNDTLTII